MRVAIEETGAIDSLYLPIEGCIHFSVVDFFVNQPEENLNGGIRIESEIDWFNLYCKLLIINSRPKWLRKAMELICPCFNHYMGGVI